MDAAKQLNTYTTSMLFKLPEKWKDYLLDPIHQSADRIESLTIRANRVYVNPKSLTPDQLRAAYQLRISLLQEALREFAVFDVKFEHMTDHIDLMQSELKRLKNIVCNLIAEQPPEAKPAPKPEGPPLLVEGDGGTDALPGDAPGAVTQIEIHQRLDQIEYTTALGTKTLKLGLTAKNRDYWLKLEQQAKTQIQKRLESDRQIAAKL